MSATVLIVDDEAKMRDVLSMAIEQLGYRALSASDGLEALGVIEGGEVDLVLSDLRMPVMDGAALLERVVADHPGLPVVIMTAHSNVKDAVRSIKDGAYDYVAKPFEIGEIERVLGNAAKLRAVTRENQRLRDELTERYSFDTLIGASDAFRGVIAAIGEVCETRANVLITGESGTGKEVVARAIHFNSPRRNRAFVAVNCSAIPETLLESELFGHVRGAFTGAVTGRTGRFEQADGGTLFLDEIGDMPVLMQAKILRVLQERVYEPLGSTTQRQADVRIIAATNRNLDEAIQAGSFREDLYYRLNVFPIALPPLRERAEDVLLLADHFLHHFGTSMGRRLTGFTERARAALTAYPWPGNIRELQNAIERAVIRARQPVIDAADLPGGTRDGGLAVAEEARGIQLTGLPLDDELARIERDLILAALDQTGGIQVKAAELLGINERSLWHRIKKLDIRIVKKPV